MSAGNEFSVQFDIYGSSNGIIPWNGVAGTHLQLDAGNITPDAHQAGQTL
jgi:hypothetical protein